MEKVEEVIIAGRRLLAKVDELLRRTEEFNRQNGFEPEALEKYMQEHLSPAQREAVEHQVKQALREVQAEADRTAGSFNSASRQPRKLRPKLIV